MVYKKLGTMYWSSKYLYMCQRYCQQIIILRFEKKVL